MKITLIVCTYNSEKRINEVINAILEQKKYNSHVEEVIIVDNNSKDGTKFILEKYGNKIKYLFEKKQGLMYARKKAIDQIKTKWVAFIDDDNILNSDWLEYCIDYINNNSNIGAFNGNIYPEFQEILTEEEKYRLNKVYLQLACTVVSKEKINYKLKKSPHKIPVGAGLVIRGDILKEFYKKNNFKTVGRKGEELLSGEDTEMCLFIKKQGLKFGFENKMIIKHKMEKSRLNIEYLKKLNFGFGKSSIILKSNKIEQNIYFIKHTLILLKKLIVLDEILAIELLMQRLLGMLEVLKR